MTNTRLHRLLLNPLLPAQAAEPYTAVTVHVTAQRMLLRLLATPGRWQGGLLIGCAADDTLHIHHVAPDGYPEWQRPLLSPDPHYALGWLDALCLTHGSPLDWVGHLVMRPDQRLPDAAEAQALMQMGQGMGLIDVHNVLLLAGLVEGRLTLQAMRVLDDQTDHVPVTLEARNDH